VDSWWDSLSTLFGKEAGGHGTDYVIRAYHDGVKIPFKVPLAKLLTSAITIGAGGSVGKEGPMTQIAGGLSSFLTEKLGLDEMDRRIALACGIGAGVGAIFKVPIGGALLSAEILYNKDLETDVLYASLVASAVAFAIFGFFKSFQPIFDVGFSEFDVNLIPFFILEGVVCGILGVLFIQWFNATERFFKNLHVPSLVKPVLGAFMVGLFGLMFPQVLGSGYGFIQILLKGDYSQFLHLDIPLLLFLGLFPFLKMIATSLTLGSGNSGGVFAPGMVIGGGIGAFLGHHLFKLAFPQIVHSEIPFILVGMTSFFGATGKISLSILPMIIEMTGNLHLVP